MTHGNNAIHESFPKERDIWWCSVILTQVRAMSAKRLLRQVDVLSEEDFKKVIEALVGLLKAEPLHKGGVPRRPKP